MPAIKRTIPALLAAGVAAASLAACSSASSGTASTAATSSGTASAAGATSAAASTSPVVAAAQAAVEKYENPPATWTGPTSAPKLAKNKFLVVVDANSAAQGAQRADSGLAAAVKAAGWRDQIIDCHGDPSQMSNAIGTAISLHADGIVMWAVPDAIVTSELQKAKAAGIPVIQAFDSPTTSPLIAHTVNFSGYQTGQAIGADIIATLGTSAKVITMNWTANGLSTQRIQGADDYITKAGGQIVGTANFQLSDLGSPSLNQIAVAALQAHPDANAVVVGFDSAAQFVAQALQQAGLASRAPVYSFEGNSPDLNDILQGTGQVADIGIPDEWTGWAVVDDFNRIFNGDKPAASDGIPFVLLTKSNLKSAAVWTGNLDYQSYYKKLWGLS